MANSFTPKKSPIPLIPSSPDLGPQGESDQAVKVSLPAPRPKRKQCSLYLDADMMEQVKRVAKRRGIAIGAVIEACVKLALEQIDQ